MYGIAIVGAGRIGRIHAANVAAHPELRLTHVSDVQPDAAANVARQYGGQATGAGQEDVTAILTDPAVDGVLIATSTNTHLDLTCRAHDAGRMVFCEKPVDLDVTRAAAAAARLSGNRIFIGFNRRFDPNFAELRARISAGVTGSLETLQITSNDPGPPPIAYIRTSGGLFADMTIHDFDMARFLLGEEPVEVFAWGASLVDPAIGEAGDIDTARILLRTGSGRLCVIANSRRSGFGYDQRIEAFCSGGMIAAANMTETTVQIWREGGAQAAPFQNFFLERYAAAYRAEIAHFADMLAGRAAPLVTFGDGVAALTLATAAKRSLDAGMPVRVADVA